MPEQKPRVNAEVPPDLKAGFERWWRTQTQFSGTSDALRFLMEQAVRGKLDEELPKNA